MPMEIHMIGIALGKTALHLVGLNARDEFVVRKKCWRIQIPQFTANPHFSLIGAKACGGAHFLALALREQGHEGSHRLAIANEHYSCMRRLFEQTTAQTIYDTLGRLQAQIAKDPGRVDQAPALRMLAESWPARCFVPAEILV